MIGEMIAAIDLNNQLSLSAIKIDSVNINSMLSAKFHIASAPIAPQLPEQRCIAILTLPQMSGKLFFIHAFGLSITHAQESNAPHPPAP